MAVEWQCPGNRPWPKTTDVNGRFKFAIGLPWGHGCVIRVRSNGKAIAEYSVDALACRETSLWAWGACVRKDVDVTLPTPAPGDAGGR